MIFVTWDPTERISWVRARMVSSPVHGIALRQLKDIHRNAGEMLAPSLSGHSGFALTARGEPGTGGCEHSFHARLLLWE